MGVWRLSTATALAVCVLICALPARALASGTEQSILMDDQQLIYSSPSRVAWTLEQAKELGIDRLKVSVVWSLVAPDPNSRRKPKFNAANPAAYPYGAWTRYDRLVEYAQQLGIGIYFQVVPPAPVWAQAQGKATQGYAWSHDPNATDYGQFVEAVARRYSGSYALSSAHDEPSSALALPIKIPGLTPQPAPDPPPAPLPAVNYWGIWNEPNEGAWLNPQTRTVGRGKAAKQYAVGPAIYRGLFDAAWKGLLAAGHTHDTVLLGEIASHGNVYPLPFVRDLYCVGGRDAPLTGAAATNLECPSSGSRSAFVAQNPGLFAASGFAHHPYSFDVSPNTRMSDPNLITLGNLGQLESTLTGTFNSYHRHRNGGVPLYLTEWGYKSDPPNPFVKTSLAQQATWINQGEYMAWRYPYVRALAQFLLVDSRPKAGEAVGSRAYWGTFQTGLLYTNLKQKPAYNAFRIPIWLPSAHHGSSVPVWGELRPADHGALQQGVLQIERRGSSSWTDLTLLQTTNTEGFIYQRVAIPYAGAVRIAWLDPSTRAVDYSRAAAVS
jgi:hypothetical protein